MRRQSRNQKVRFAHVDRAGIVFYPRYVEMLADVYPAFAGQAAGSCIELVFRAPARLGEWLAFRELQADGDDLMLGVDALHGERLVFECRQRRAAAMAEMPSGAQAFRRERGVSGWLVGADRRLHLSRYYEMLSDTVEDWFSDEVGVPFPAMFAAEGVSTPTVRLATTVRELPALGEAIAMNLSVARLGTSSITLDVRLTRDADVLVRTEQVLVTALRDPMRAVPVPDDIVAGIERMTAGGG